MFIRLVTAAALAVLATCATAVAAPVTVQVRIEGLSSTLFEGPVTTDGRPIDGGDGTGLHPCGPGPSATSALEDASTIGGFDWLGNWDSGYGDFLIDRIAGEANDQVMFRFWGYAVNFVAPSIGGCQRQVAAGDEIVWAYDSSCNCPPDYTKPYLRLTGPPQATVSESITVTVTNGKTGLPVSGATVDGRLTRSDGRARLSFATPGLKRLKAERSDSVRSNALVVCVAPVAGGGCGVPAVQGDPSGSAVRDSTAPTVRISRPRSGRRYRRGPRLLRGTARDAGSGVRTVELSLRRTRRGTCSQWSGRRERFVGRRCRKATFFEAGSGARWSYLLPERLPRGHYTLDVRAVDGAGNRADRFVRGRTRIVFVVIGRR